MKKLILFTTESCVPCKAFKEIFDREEELYSFVEFETLDAHKDRDMAIKYQVRTSPALVLLNDEGVQIGYKVHPYDQNDIYNLVMGESK